jgi:DNA-binding response OmpR family regulator
MPDNKEIMEFQAPPLAILHICRRETLRPLRDQVLRISGYQVDSTLSNTEAISFFGRQLYQLVLIDVEGESGIHEAESLCSEVRTAHRGQLVAFVCNWRVAVLTDCPDEILRTEFDPAAFLEGVRSLLSTTLP